MAISFDSAFGIHPKALSFRSERSEVLSANIANADTPGYKAKDIRFADLLDSAAEKQMAATRDRHFNTAEGSLAAETLYRNPQQASVDGNTVETHVEQAEYAQNALQYQASLRFVNGKISGILSALKGE